MDSMQFKVLFQMFLQFCHALISELTLNPGVCFKFQRNGTIHNSVMKCQLMDGSKNSGSMHKITMGINFSIVCSSTKLPQSHSHEGNLTARCHRGKFWLQIHAALP